MTTPDLICYNCGLHFGNDLPHPTFDPRLDGDEHTPCSICGRDDKPVYEASLFGTIDTSKHEVKRETD